MGYGLDPAGLIGRPPHPAYGDRMATSRHDGWSFARVVIQDGLTICLDGTDQSQGCEGRPRRPAWQDPGQCIEGGTVLTLFWFCPGQNGASMRGDRSRPMASRSGWVNVRKTDFRYDGLNESGAKTVQRSGRCVALASSDRNGHTSSGKRRNLFPQGRLFLYLTGTYMGEAHPTTGLAPAYFISDTRVA
jgi:hypothetical protein